MVGSRDQRNTRKNTRFKTLGHLLFLGAAFSPDMAFANRVLVDRIVADVNAQPILFSEIQAKLKRGHDIVVSEFPAPANASDFEKSLQDQINFELIMQRSEQLEITVDDQQVEAEIKKFIAGKNISMDSLRESLRGEGMTYEDYKADFRDQMILRDFQGRVIRPSVKVTEKDLENFYLRRMGAASESVSVRLRQLVIQSSGGSEGDANAKKQIDDAYAQLKGGLNFEAAIERYSTDAASKANKGLLPQIKLGDLATDLRNRIETLAANEYTAPMEIGSNYVIFQLVERSLTTSDEFKKQKPRLEQELMGQEMVAQTMSWLADQRRRAKPRVIPE